MSNLRLLLISIILFSQLFSGCRDKSKDSAFEKNGLIRLSVDVDNAGTLLYSDIFEKPRFVPLETTMYSLVGDIYQIVFNDKFIIVVMGVPPNKILLFDHDGKFINSIYNQGRGPGEYLHLSYVDVDEKNGHIWFFEPQGYFICMDYEGNFLERIRINNAYSYAMFKHPFTEQLLLDLVNGAAFDPDDPGDQTYYHILSYNRKSDLTELWLPMPGNFTTLNAPGFSRFEERVYYMPIMWDTIYTITESEASPYYLFDFGKYRKPERIYSAADNNTIREVRRNNAEFVLYNRYFRETSSLIISIHQLSKDYKSILSIYDKATGKSNTYTSAFNDYLGFPENINFFRLTDKDEEVLITYQPSFFLKNDKELRERLSETDYRRFMATNPSYAQMIREIKESDNPVIAIYPIK